MADVKQREVRGMADSLASDIKPKAYRPRIVDEWQLAPAIWDEVRHRVDDDSANKGQWILTGSSTPLNENGRTIVVRDESDVSV